MARKSEINFEDLPDFFGAQELSQVLGIGINQARQVANRPNFPYIPIGRKKVIPKLRFIEWVKSGNLDGEQ